MEFKILSLSFECVFHKIAFVKVLEQNWLRFAPRLVVISKTFSLKDRSHRLKCEEFQSHFLRAYSKNFFVCKSNRLRHQNNGSILGLLASLAKLAAKLVLARNAEEPYSYFFSRQGKEKRRWNLLIDFYHLRTNFSSKRNLREKNEGARVEIELLEFRQSMFW